MPRWVTNIRSRLQRRGPTPLSDDPATEAAVLESAREPISEKPVASPPHAPSHSFSVTLVRLLPVVVLGAGLMMTVFAETLGPWAVLGFLLVAVSPVLFLLRRIEHRLAELVEAAKAKRR